MSRIKFGTVFFVAVAFFAVLVVHAQSNKQVQLEKAKQKAVTEIKPAPASIPQTPAPGSPKQGYQMVTDVLDGFGGKSESDSFRISVSSGGQPSAIGISESDTLVVKAGFVLASDVKHGDANSDGAVAPGDVVFLINYLFRGGPEPCPMEAGDANCDGAVAPGDVVYLINYLFRGGPPPAC